MSNDLKRRIETLLPRLRDLRHELHAHPETGFDLPRTTGLVAARLREMGLSPVEGVGGCGVTAVIGGGEGPAIALRADMDALPIVEETGAAYASQHEGKMHACGHDGHTTMLLGAAEILAAEPDLLPGPVKLLFQPAEEIVQGARAMIEDGALVNPRPKAVFGLHGWPGMRLGRIGVREGAMMASSDTFDAVVRGRGGHAAHPEGTIDPIVVAAQIITAWQTVVTRQTAATDPLVVSVTKLDAGTAYNIIPPEARLSGTFRTVSETTRKAAPQRMRELAAGICKAFGAGFEMTVKPGTAVTANDPRMARYVADTAAEAFGSGAVEWVNAPAMGAEDFGVFAAEVPGAFFWLGLGDRPFCHSPHFDFPDEAIGLGVEMFVRLARGNLPE